MEKMKIFLGLAILVLGSLQATEGQYTACVVEYNFVNYSTPNQTIEENIKNYIYQIESGKNQGCQIIVFPEYGLTGLVTDPSNYSIEIPSVGVATYTDYFLNRLSTAALEHQMYVVVNLLEKAKNDKNETIYYNTNVVFDKQAAIAAKYRKINLFLEPNITPGNETVTFLTDFGVTFGIFTCADILYYHPSKSILENNVTSDIIFPTAWTSYLPFYMSTSVQYGYSIANNVNLLAANLNNPSEANGGSGIYRKDGIILRRYLSGRPSTILLAASVDSVTVNNDFNTFGFDILRNETVDELDNYALKYDFAFDKYVFKPVTFGTENNTQEICDGTFCCTFSFEAHLNETNATEVYKLMAYDGKVRIGDRDEHLRLCDLVACQSDDISSCGYKPNSTLTTQFRSITVTGNFKRETYDFYQPVALRGNLLPITNITFRVTNITSDEISIRLSTNKTETNVLAFGLIGRSSAATFGLSSMLVVTLFFAKTIF